MAGERAARRTLGRREQEVRRERRKEARRRRDEEGSTRVGRGRGCGKEGNRRRADFWASRELWSKGDRNRTKKQDQEEARGWGRIGRKSDEDRGEERKTGARRTL